MKIKKLNASLIFSFSGFIFFVLAFLFLKTSLLAGIFSLLGLMFLIVGGRSTSNRLDIILNAILILISHGIRFCRIFGSEYIYTLYVMLLFIPYTLLIFASLFLDRFLQKKKHPILAILVIPSFYGILSLVLALVNFGYVTNLLSYLMCIPLIGVNLYLVGEYILTFILMLILTCLVSLLLKSPKKVKIIYVIISFSLLVSLLGSGLILNSRYDKEDYSINVALATCSKYNFVGDEDDIPTIDEQLDLFTKAIKKASDNDAKLLVLHEEYFFWYIKNHDAYIARISNIIKQYKIPTLIGVDAIASEDDELHKNMAVFFDENGEVLATYVKNNLVPFIEKGYFEDGPNIPATVNINIDNNNLDIAFIICYDLNDSLYLKKIPKSTELLIDISWDWDDVNMEQKRTYVLSSIVNTTLLKHSYDGFSTVSNPNGKLVSSLDFRGEYETLKMISVPIYKK